MLHKLRAVIHNGIVCLVLVCLKTGRQTFYPHALTLFSIYYTLKWFLHVSYFIIAALLQNYRCHSSIVKLSATLFKYPHLKSLSRIQLHPLSNKSGLEFVATSLDSKVELNNGDTKLYYDEALMTLKQVIKHKRSLCSI